MSSTADGTTARARMPRVQREAQILAVAEDVFAERGYQATTMEDVAERVGVTKPLIYEYFGSKEGLLAACINHARTQLREATVASWQRVDADAPLDAMVEAGVRAFFDFIDEHANAFLLIQQEGTLAAQASPGIEQIRAEQSAVTAEMLRRSPSLAEVPDVLLEGYAEVLIGACERVAVWRTRHAGVSADDATDLVMASVWRGLGSIAPS